MGTFETVKALTTQYLGIDPDECTEENYIDKLEDMLEKANAYAREGKELFVDAIYDTCMDYLRELNPDSPILHQVWSGDDETVAFDEEVDRFLLAYPMLSIRTIKDIDDPVVDNFISKLPDGETIMHLSMKENGHGIRVCLYDGYVSKATSRGRSTNGRDLTMQVKRILGEYLEAFKDAGLVELRGEILLPFSNLEKAKQYNPDIKSAFSGVASMLRDSATKEETELLKFVAYDIISDTLTFKTLDDKYEYLKSCGLTAPLAALLPVTRDNFKQNIVNCIDYIAEHTKDYDFYTDGIVATVNDIELFQNLGSEEKYRLGNLAFKIRRWEQNVYCGRVREIKWKPGKSKLSPVCVVEDPDTGELGVLTGTGNSVKNVPMYAPCYLLTLSAYPGELIYFKYGGEAGVVPCTATGILVTDKASMQTQEEKEEDEDEVIE